MGGLGQRWPAARSGALSVAVRAGDLSKEVAINPTTEPPELTQEWGNRLLEGTDKTLCAPGTRKKEQ